MTIALAPFEQHRTLGPKARELVGAFLAGRKATTLRAYEQSIEEFRRFVGASTREAAADVLVGCGPGEANLLALAFRSHLVEAGRAPKTINLRLSALRNLVKLARTIGAIPWSLEVENVKTELVTDTRGCGVEGFRALLAEADKVPGAKRARDRAILRLLFDRCLRRGEVVGLDLEDLDRERGTLRILGKGRAAKEEITLPAPTIAALEEWVATRGSAPGPLFTNLDRAHRGERISGAGLYAVVRAYGIAAGLRGPPEPGRRVRYAVRPHGLRHAAITAALERTGGNLRAVQKFSRHRDLRLLQVYDDAREDLGGQVASLVAEAL